MEWLDVKRIQPLDRQIIFVYSTDMDEDLWKKEYIWPLLEWHEKENGAWDPISDKYLHITHWLPIPITPKQRELIPTRKVKRPKNNNSYSFWA